MSELITVARPYAKAAFDFAVEQQDLDEWQQMLTFAAQASQQQQVINLLSGALAPQAQAQMFITLCGDSLNQHGQNLIKVMAENKRLAALPDVLALFLKHRADLESTIDVEVISANQLDNDQLAKITTAMEKRLSRKVQLNCTLDKSVIAGVIIRQGDMVIDGSIRGRLERLADALQS